MSDGKPGLETADTIESSAPVDASPAPADASRAPADASLAPADASPAPADASPASADASPSPAEGSPAPADDSPAVADASSDPNNANPVQAADDNPAPDVASSSSDEASPVQAADDNPAPAPDPSPASAYDNSPAPDDASPAPGDADPAQVADASPVAATPDPALAADGSPAPDDASSSPDNAAENKDPEKATTDQPRPKDKFFLGRLKHAHTHASGPCEFLKAFFLIILHTVGFLVIAGILLGIPFAMIVVGAIHLNNCPVERFIPIWLIVSGAVIAFLQLIFIFNSISNRQKETLPEHSESNRSYSCFNLLFTMFILAWFIAGNVWVFRVYQPNINDVNRSDYCEPGPYFFAFVIIIVAYAWMLLMCCCSSCVAIFGIKNSPKQKSTTTPTG